MTSFLLSDTELHGLVDGQIEFHHRADVLRRAASSIVDRERIGIWQSQRELIRSAFEGIEREPLPSMLDLSVPTKLHLLTRPPVPANDVPPIVATARWRDRLVLPGLAALVAVAGLCLTWLAGGFSWEHPGVVAGGAVDLAPAASSLPMTIPDLSTLGFAFSEAERHDGASPSMQFRYRDAASRQLTLSVTPAMSAASASARPDGAGRAPTWIADTRRYALTGTLTDEQLLALVPLVRDLASEE